MRKNNTDIIESTITNTFRLKPGNISEYSFKERTGFIKREIGEICYLESGGFINRAELLKNIPKNLHREFSGIDKERSNFDLGMTARAGNQLSLFLNRVSDLQWDVIFKSLEKRKVVKRDKNKLKTPFFSHCSVLIRFRKKNWNGFIEIGEGSTTGSGFNITGLTARVDEIIRGKTEVRRISLPENIPVIINSGEGGIIFHEILGHSLEADHMYRGLSPFRVSDIGKKLVSGNITLSTSRKDDPFFANMVCDDDGDAPCTETLIEKGIIRHIISDRLFSDYLGVPDRGSSRMEDFTRRPMPRMSAIYLVNGKHSLKDLLNSTEKGVFAKEFGEGKVLFHKNLFYFNIPAAYMIERGKISEPLGSIVVSGKINKVFNSVEMVANDFSYDRGISYCYKDGQTLNVRVGQPSVKICNLKLSRGLSDL